MADNYLENHYEDYLKRKAAWEKNKGRTKLPKKGSTPPVKPDDEAL